MGRWEIREGVFRKVGKELEEMERRKILLEEES